MSIFSATPVACHHDRSQSLDRVGLFLSSACAIHCMVMPFALGMLAVGGAEWLGSEIAEMLLVGAATIIGVVSLAPSYLRHRNPAALAFFFAGLAVIVTCHLLLEEHTPALGVCMAVGGGLIAMAHYRNRQASHCAA
jgi:hypothetical protein